MAAVHFGYEVLSVECLVPEYSRLAEIWADEEKITLLNGCASNRLGLQKFHLASGSSSLHAEAVGGGPERDKASSDGFKTSRALTFPLDAIIESSYAEKRLCVVKIDTQGHELMVMEGLRASIVRHRPIVIFEWDPRFGPFVNLTIPWIRSLSYDCAVPGVLQTAFRPQCTLVALRTHHGFLYVCSAAQSPHRGLFRLQCAVYARRQAVGDAAWREA